MKIPTRISALAYLNELEGKPNPPSILTEVAKASIKTPTPVKSNLNVKT